MSKTITVLQLNEYVNSLLLKQPVLQNLSVVGEMSNMRAHSSGHLYFTLKSETAAVKCVMFRYAASRLSFLPKDGQEVIAEGAVQLYVKDGQYQLYVDTIRLSGEGALYKQFVLLKEALEKKGYFDEEIKKPIPEHVRSIGVVTSPTGAVIRDIINVATRRDPSIKIILYPVSVQGACAAHEIAHAIDRLNTYKNIDVIIAGRGGGSIEDLWAFNELAVAEAIFRSKIPVISAVGHQTDFTIADFVADLRAPTPSAAAEQAVQDRGKRIMALNTLKRRLINNMESMIAFEKRRLSALKDSYPLKYPERIIGAKAQQLDHISTRLHALGSNQLLLNKHKLEELTGKFHALSPERVLKRGYAIICNPENKPIHDINEIHTGERVTIRMYGGKREALITEEE